MIFKKLAVSLAASLVAWAGTTGAHGQDPGVTKPTLEAMVGNSAQVMVVRVKSFETDSQGPVPAVVRVAFDVRERLKLPWGMPAIPEADPREEAAASPAVETFAGPHLASLRSYGQADWGYELASPVGGLDQVVPAWHEEQTDLLLFRDFATPKVTVQMLVDIGNQGIVQNDWTMLTDEAAIRDRIATLVDRYRGVEKLRLVFVSTNHFAPVVSAMAGNQDVDIDAMDARSLCMPADADYEKLLLAQIKHPAYLHDDHASLNVSHVEWLRFTRDIYSFDSRHNAETLTKLVDDPAIGMQQRALLQSILEAW